MTSSARPRIDSGTREGGQGKNVARTPAALVHLPMHVATVGQNMVRAQIVYVRY